MTVRRDTLFTFIALFCSIFIGSLVHAPSAQAIYTKAQINDKLSGGVNTAITWDKTCYNNMKANRAAGKDPRWSINNGGAYTDATWLSVANHGNTVEATVDAGTTSVNLQLNAITFLCSSLVSPDGAGADYAYSNARVVRTDNAPNDRKPNPLGGNTNWPARSGTLFRVSGTPKIAINGGAYKASGGDNGKVSLASGANLTTGYQSSTRYWFATKTFTYTPKSALTTTATITIQVPRKIGAQYYGNQYYCAEGGSPTQYKSWDAAMKKCPQNPQTFSIKIKVNPKWSTTGTTTVKVNGTAGATTASPGDKIVWTHQLKNNGPSTSSSIESKTVNSGFGDDSYNGTKNIKSGTMASGATRSPADKTEYTVKESDVGATLCQQLQWTPTNSSGGKNGTSSKTCVTIPYNYSLTPSVTLDKTIADSGDTVSIAGNLTNENGSKTDDTTWQFSYIVIPTGTSTPPSMSGNSESGSTPCAYYKSKASTITCTAPTFSGGTTATNGSQVFTFSSSNYTFPDRQAIVPDLPVGTKICYALSVKGRSSTSTDWQHSNLACVVIGKHPVLQTYGGDVIVGRNGGSSGSNIATSIKTVLDKRYGSWSEYGIIAAGSVSGMASASGYAGGVDPVGICAVSNLTLNNRTNPTDACLASAVGSYTYGAASSTVANRFAIVSTTPQISGDVTVSSLASGKTYTNNTSGSEIRLTMGSPATLPAGKWVVINAPNATVKIMGDLRYTTSALTKLSDIPQIVIIAKNIIVSDSVTQIDAWLVATGTGTEGRINTCGAGGVTEATTITSKNCDKKLTVNGPVITNRLILRRTAGAGTGTASGDPAEVFNLRPDAYLWALSLQTSTPKAQTVQTVELPPRY